MNRPFSESCMQNQAVIFETIKLYLHGKILEIGSGTGQHAIYFSELLPGVIWQTSDVGANIPGIESWIAHSELVNLPPTISLDVFEEWPDQQYDAIYSANCFHIMGHSGVEKSFEGISKCLKADGYFIAYGPFKYNGKFTSDSNQRFEQW
jgi:cyclopropane fatty-acyl-phospholipid synthase-like methyltransferase